MKVKNICCPSLDRRIGAAFSLRSKYGGRRRSSHLGYIEIYKTRSHSVRSRLEYSGSSLVRPNMGPLLPFGSKYGGPWPHFVPHHNRCPPNHPFCLTWNQESTRKNYNSETSLK